MTNTVFSRPQGRRPRWAAAVGLFAIASILITGCASDDSSTGDASATGSGAATDEFVLYASLGLSGPSSAFATAIEAGIGAAVTTINDSGGLLGKQVRADVENNESVPTTAVSDLQNRLRDDRPDLVWAGSTSAETLPMLDLTTREKVIALNNGSAPAIGDASKFPYSFSAGVGNVAQANFILKELEAKGYKNVGILTASGAFGEALSKQYQETFQAAGLTVIPESYEPDAVEMDGPLGRINDANPDVVVFNDFVHPAYALKSRIKVGMADVPFIGDISTTINDMSQTVSTEEKDGVLLSSYKVQTSAADRPGVTNLLATLKENNVTISSGLYLYALAYDTVLAYANAVEAIGSTDVDAVRAAMEAGKGDKYQLSLTDSIGWTQDTHIGSGQDENLFTLIPVSPMVSGQFQLAG